MKTAVVSEVLGIVIHQLDEIIQLAEAQVPANPASPDNERLERKYARLMAGYFKQLEQAFPYDKLAELYYKYVAVESRLSRIWRRIVEAGPISDVNAFMDPLLRAFSNRLLTDVIGQHVAIYLAGSAQMTFWGRTKGGIPIAYEGPPIQQAISYAQKHCATLVTQMGEESKRLIAQTVSDGIANKRGIDGLARDIRRQFTDMRKVRSQTIARTESCDALQSAFVDRSKDMGVTGKEWVVTDPCPICQQNAGIVVPLDGVFPSGDSRPPAHPRCRCALAPAMIGEK